MPGNAAFALIFLVFLSACTSTGQLPAASPTAEDATPLPPAPTPIPTSLPSPSEKFLPPAPTAGPTPSVNFASPLAGKTIADLEAMISNPFHPPRPGSDDPHQGVDFSEMDSQTQIALAGLGVQAIIPGEVVAVMQDRFPWGNALITATDIDALPPGWKEMVLAAELPAAWDGNTALSCPPGWNDPPNDQSGLVLYILYAHLHEAVVHAIGDVVQTGDPIGIVGMSGNALAPHLHVELRYGYRGEISGSMAHYDVSASPQEMGNYCRWRVSGWLRLLNIMELLAAD